MLDAFLQGAKAPARAPEARRSESTGSIGNVVKITAYVNHYSFPIMDVSGGT